MSEISSVFYGSFISLNVFFMFLYSYVVRYRARNVANGSKIDSVLLVASSFVMMMLVLTVDTGISTQWISDYIMLLIIIALLMIENLGVHEYLESNR